MITPSNVQCILNFKCFSGQRLQIKCQETAALLEPLENVNN